MNALSMRLGTRFQLKSLYKKSEIARPYMTATAADSLGVNSPVQMPPMMMMGINNAGPASRAAAQICAGVERSSPLSHPVRLPCQMQTMMRAMADKIAGTRPAIDSAFIDTPDTNA